MRISSTVLMVLLITSILTSVACDSDPANTSGLAARELPSEIASAVAQAEEDVIAAVTKSGGTYCGRLCQHDFWLKSNVADLNAELRRGAEVNVNDGYGSNPLHYAALLANYQVVEALLDKGARVNSLNSKHETPLYVVATGGGSLLSRGHGTTLRYQDPAVVALLLERGADPNTPNSRGATAMHGVRDPVVAALLIAHGADVEARTDEGETPLYYSTWPTAASMVRPFWIGSSTCPGFGLRTGRGGGKPVFPKLRPSGPRGSWRRG